MKWCLLAAALLHTGFMFAEMFPWPMPFLVERLSPEPAHVTVDQIAGNAVATALDAQLEKTQKLLVTVARNAGIYNGVIAAALFWAFVRGRQAREFALLLCAGVLVVGTFGALTISEPALPAIQAALGLLGMILALRDRRPPETSVV